MSEDKKKKKKDKKDTKDTKVKKKEKKEKGDIDQVPDSPVQPQEEKTERKEKDDIVQSPESSNGELQEKKEKKEKSDIFKSPVSTKVDLQQPQLSDDDDMNDGPEEEDPLTADGSPWKNPLKFWTNKPKKLNETGAKYILKSLPRTDCFRQTEKTGSDSASFYWVKAKGDFDVLVKIKGNFRTIYDKAGIMIRDDEKTWVLSGVEYFNGKLNHSTSITNGVSDWSLAPVPEEARDGLWICVKRAAGEVTCYFSVDAQRWIQTRQALFPSSDIVKVGIAAACPMGDPYKVVFERFEIKNHPNTM